MKKEEKLTNINTYLIIALVIVVAIGLYFTLSVPVVKKEVAKPVPPKEIMVTVLQGCEDCFNISVAVDFLKQQKNLNITKTDEVSMEDAKAEAKKYNISKLPAIIITGDIANLTIPNFNAQEGVLVFDQSLPPYYDMATKSVKGKVEFILLEDKNCTECFDMKTVIDQLKQAGIKITSEKTVDSNSDEGKGLISKYKIEKIPTILFNKDALIYDVVNQVWSQVGSEEDDGRLVLRLVSPPYVNVSTGKTEGLVELTLLVDESCTDCYNVSMLKDLFKQSFNMAFKKDETVDVSSTKGKFIVKKYGIELVPTLILSKDAAAYPSLTSAWGQVGTEEKDGAFVFRNVPMLKDVFEQQGGFAYKNLTSGEILPKKEAEAEITQPSEES